MPENLAAKIRRFTSGLLQRAFSFLRFYSLPLNKAAQDLLLPLMSEACTIIFPHQLYEAHPALQAERAIFLVEESLFFTQYAFHQQKLLLHRASMSYYQSMLQNRGYRVERISALQPEADIRLLLPYLHYQGFREIHLADPSDDWLQRRLQKAAGAAGIRVKEYPGPGFLTKMEAAHEYLDSRKKYFHADFYTWQRRQTGILLDPANQPVGGKWSFDAENQKKLPKGLRIPELKAAPGNSFLHEARLYVEKAFSANPGTMDDFCYPVTHADARQWLDNFLQQRFAAFGEYEDAMSASESFLFHSVLTPALNIGLLTPQEVIDAALDFAQHHQVPLNSLEGFIRQVIGWREFIHLVYRREGRRQRTNNYWQFSRSIPPAFYSGTTGIEPIDTVIRRILKTGYCHHIERLMVLGNFFLLCEFDPDEVYRWFMELFIDSYDWVMVPNVYGMSQFADGGMMTTKPYISGSNYLLKMGDWKKGPWQAVWDGLFWRFLHVHRDFFASNPRLGMLLNTWDKMPKEKQTTHLSNADAFLASLV